MHLLELTLQNFRSYAKKTFAFSPETTLIVGPNTAGKTNILEAIMFLACGKSFRADADREAIAWDADVSRVTCHVSRGEDDTVLELVQTNGEIQGKTVPSKRYLVNGVARRQIDFVGNLRAVLFWPEHLELVTDSPNLRRRYLDSVLIQVDREYRRNLFSYERGLRQRNRLLDLISEGKADRRQLLFWNQLLIAAGGYLTEKRASYIDFVNAYHISHITYHVIYDQSVISESRLEQYKEEEVAAKATLVGPHRDDFEIAKRDTKYVTRNTEKMFDVSHITSPISLSSYGSRGEQRLAVLWLKLAELSFIEEKTGERPLLLLDDIFSELDEKHRDLVLHVIEKQQTIITSAEEGVVHLVRKASGMRSTVIQLSE